MSEAKPAALRIPAGGEKITIANGRLKVPDRPVIPFIEGDGTGRDIWRASVRVFDAAVHKAYGGRRKIHWMEVFAGEKANKTFNTWLPDETVEACREYLVSIKGPLTTPVGGGIRSLNVALRQMLDLYVCLRPVRWFKGVPSPVKAPEKVDMVIFRENTEDIYAGIEFEAGTPDAQKFLELFKQDFPEAVRQDPLPGELRHRHQAGLEGGHRAAGPRRHRVRARQQAQERHARAQGQHHEVHRGRVPQLGLPARRTRVRRAGLHLGAVGAHQGGAAASKRPTRQKDAAKRSGKILVKDAIADITLQQVLTRPEEFDVIATMNLNGDYLSDALAAQVGGIGIAPGGNINYLTGHAVFEATHGTAPKYADLDKVNPGSVILSGEMMLRYLGWVEAADAIIGAMDGTIAQKIVTYDFARLMEGATEVKCSEFGDNLIRNL